MKTIQFLSIMMAIGFLFASCGKNYDYEKVIVNNSRETVQVQLLYDHDNSIYTIAPGERKVVFECIYQSYRKPKKDDVSNKFTVLNATPEAEAHIKNSDNWSMTENGKQFQTIYVFEEQ